MTPSDQISDDIGDGLRADIDDEMCDYISDEICDDLGADLNNDISGIKSGDMNDDDIIGQHFLPPNIFVTVCSVCQNES